MAFSRSGCGDCKNALIWVETMVDDLKKHRRMKEISLDRFVYATPDVGHPLF
jgi:hypothetical protein